MYEGLIGNDNAVKYTEDKVIALLTAVYEKSKQPDCYYILSAMDGILTWAQWDYFNASFADNKTVFGIIKSIAQNCEQHLLRDMLAGNIKETASIFLLKCKYGYQDKQVVEVEHKGNIAINFQFPVEEDQ